jgi:hypothetical protein
MMTTYIVHIYREMRLSFTDIEADTPAAAAVIARGKPTGDADDIDDCDGEDLSALVDLAGDEEYEHSVTIDFETERQRKAAAKLLAALMVSEGLVHWALDHGADRPATAAALEFIRTAIAEAKATGIPSVMISAAQPSRFEMEHDSLENPDRAYVLVDGRFDVAIIRTAEGIVIDVYPKDWIDPIDSLTVWDEDVAAASASAEAGDAGEA